AFTVAANETLALNRSTTIRADSAQILGSLLLLDAQEGDAPMLCIMATSLSVAGTLCTGRGLDGTLAIGPVAQGGDGTNGGDLIIRLLPNDTAPATLSVSSGGLICTGSGGDGGPAFASPDSPQMQVITLKQLTQVYTFCQSIIGHPQNPGREVVNKVLDYQAPKDATYAEPSTLQVCSYLMTVQDILQDPQGYVCGRIMEGHPPAVVCDPIDTHPDPDDLPGLDDVPSVEVCELPGMELVPVACGPVPDKCSLVGVKEVPGVCKPVPPLPCTTLQCLAPWLHCEDPEGCVPPPPCPELDCTQPVVDAFLQAADAVLRLVNNVCPLGDPSQPCGANVCNYVQSSPSGAWGGQGGDAGAMTFEVPATAVLDVNPGSLVLGNGGAGGLSFAFGAGTGLNSTAVSGRGGDSLAYLDGEPLSSATALPGLVDGFVRGGKGGDGGLAYANEDSDLVGCLLGAVGNLCLYRQGLDCVTPDDIASNATGYPIVGPNGQRGPGQGTNGNPGHSYAPGVDRAQDGSGVDCGLNFSCP
ncbi:MAG: hypothetical protein LC623_09915, partial [Halobacteriales archaeon]|nr:hypothetical protein [Halobacteriales archaeon]